MKQYEYKFSFLPEAINDCEKVSDLETTCEVKGKYPCPCCCYNTFPVPKEDAIAYICPVCFWENDVFTSSDDEPSDENRVITLNECRINYKILGACSQDMLIHVREPKSDEFPK